jgi:septum site-determining protein MinC
LKHESRDMRLFSLRRGTNQVRFGLLAASTPPFMPVSPPAAKQSAAPKSFEIKSAQLPLVALLVHTTDWQQLQQDLLAEFGPQGESPDFFDHDALVVDFSALPGETPVDDIVPVLRTLRQCNLMPVAIRGASDAWMQAARELGLCQAEPEVYHHSRPAETQALPAVAVQEVVREVVHEVVREVPGPATMVVDKPLRSGQKVYARGADLVVLAPVNQGAEVVADGNIHVYSTLRGKAMAGARGNVNARIFALNLDPELVSIAGVYRTSENPLAPEVRGKSAQVRLSDDGLEKLLFEALKS